MSRVVAHALPVVLALLPLRPLLAQDIALPASRKELEQEAVKDSNDAAAHFNAALAEWNDHDWDAAERQLNTAIEIEPRFAQAYLARAALVYARNTNLLDEAFENSLSKKWKDSVAKADRDYRHAFLLDPLCDLRVLGAMERRSGVLLQGEFGWIGEFLNGSQMLVHGDYEKAYEHMDEAVKDPIWKHAGRKLPLGLVWFRGLAAAHAGKWDAAKVDFRMLLDSSLAVEQSDSLMIHVPLETNDYRYMLAVIEQKTGQLDTATALFQQALDRDLGLYMAHVHLAEIAQTQHRLGDALVERERALAANPDDPSLLFDLGYLQGEVGQLESSVTNLTHAAKLDPRDSRIDYYLGRVEELAHDTADARSAYARFVALAPSRYARWISDARIRLAALH